MADASPDQPGRASGQPWTCVRTILDARPNHPGRPSEPPWTRVRTRPWPLNDPNPNLEPILALNYLNSQNPWTMVRPMGLNSQKSMDHVPAHGPKFTKIDGPWSGPWAKIHKNPWTMVRPMGLNSQKSMDHGPAHGP